ncbi:MAG: M48 family metallopeptidase [Burkholderia gladioli]
MSAYPFTLLFAAAILAMVGTKLWLATRQIRFVAAHRGAVPAQFRDTIPLTAHQRAADYTVARTRLTMLQIVASAVLLIALTLFGGVGAIDHALRDWLGGGYGQQILLIAAVLLITSAIEIPFDYVRQFGIEGRFGFNRMTRKLFFADLARNTAVGALLGLPLLFVVLWLMNRAGPLWWLWTWIVWVAFQMLVLYPSFIAPLFNKFEPLGDEALRARIEGLMKRCGFAAKGLFVMDGSRRSAHGNAYFTGFGATKRIVFFDTLLARLSGSEIEAVLANELGHFKRRHIVKRMLVTFVLSLALLALLGWLAGRTWFYTGLGALPSMAGSNASLALTLTLFFLAVPVFLFFVTPLSSMSSRKHEFEADAFAASQTDRQDLVNALVKLYEDNASTLTPAPVYTAFYYSHPPASQRIDRLLRPA